MQPVATDIHCAQDPAHVPIPSSRSIPFNTQLPSQTATGTTHLGGSLPTAVSAPVSVSTVAYAFVSPSDPRSRSDLDLLRHWCAGCRDFVEILTEEVHPRERGSKIWSEVLCRIESGGIKTLIVPSLFHIVGNDFIALSKFLTYLKTKGARIRSIREFIESDRYPHQDIVANFYQAVVANTALGCGQ